VKIDDDWRLVDATWGAGTLSGKKYKKKYSDFYFLVPGDRLIFTHFPENEKWQLLDPVVTRRQFDDWPRADDLVFNLQPNLTGTHVREQLEPKGVRDFLTVYAAPAPFTLISGPISQKISAGGKYRFEIEAPGYSAMAVKSGGVCANFQKKG